MILDNTEYIFDDLHKLPEDLHPRQFSYRSNDQWIMFGGPHSVFNFLSNYFPQQITHNDIVHDTVEHGYQYSKAMRYKDTATADRILSARTPAIAKQLGSKVANFDRADWDGMKGDLMQTLLRIKFAQGTKLSELLKETSGKSLAEAGRSRSFAVGMSLNHKNIFDRTKWAHNGNLLGRSLMMIRDEFN